MTKREETPLDANLDHRLLRVFREGMRARDTGAEDPYRAGTLEHCLHASGWVSRDLSLALQRESGGKYTAPELLAVNPAEGAAKPIEPAKSEVAHDPVEHPKHYTGHPSGVECIAITEHMNFCLGNAVKYIWRAGEKGDTLTDLKKARWYIDREIERLSKKA